MIEKMLLGELVRLVVEEPDVEAETFVRWSRNSEFLRLLDSEPPALWSKKKALEWIEKDLESDEARIGLSIRTTEGDRPIGFVGLDGIRWNQGDSYVAIGIGEEEFWGKGYGTEAMRLMIQYVFRELNFRRLTLTVFEYNQRAFRSYQKLGFQVEGRVREFMRREGRWWDLVFMGILREDWEQGEKH
jgi:RimJ/RimL family protein N-acetyltransferase